MRICDLIKAPLNIVKVFNRSRGYTQAFKWLIAWQPDSKPVSILWYDLSPLAKSKPQRPITTDDLFQSVSNAWGETDFSKIDYCFIDSRTKLEVRGEVDPENVSLVVGPKGSLLLSNTAAK